MVKTYSDHTYLFSGVNTPNPQYLRPDGNDGMARN